jgi:hypothetical protein
VVVCLVDIGGIVDYHCLNSSFTMKDQQITFYNNLYIWQILTSSPVEICDVNPSSIELDVNT